MSTQSKTMPQIDLKMFVRSVALMFLVSSGTALVMSTLRATNPELYYLEPLTGTHLGIHYFITGLMIVTSAIGLANSAAAVRRPAAGPPDRAGLTTWLLLDSLFEASRVVYVFVCEIVLDGKGWLQVYELLVSGAQYLVDSFLYCQMILRH